MKQELSIKEKERVSNEKSGTRLMRPFRGVVDNLRYRFVCRAGPLIYEMPEKQEKRK